MVPLKGLIMKKSYLFILSALIIIGSLFAAAKVEAQPEVRVGGYMQAWGLYSYTENLEPHEDVWGYRLRRARLTALTQLSENLTTTTWLEFAGRQNNLLDFHFDYRFSAAANIRVGQFRPHAQAYDTGTLGSAGLIFAERPEVTPFLASQMGFDAFRDIGMMMYGRTDRLYYAIHATNGMGRFTQAGTNITSRSFGSGSYGARADFDLTDNLLLGGHVSLNQQRDVVVEGNEPYDVDRYSTSLRLVSDEMLLPGLYSQTEAFYGTRNDTQEFDYDGLYTQVGYRMHQNLHLLSRFDYLARRYQDADNELTQAVTLGAMRLFQHQEREIARIIVNYNLASQPDDSLQHLITAVFQVRFIP